MCGVVVMSAQGQPPAGEQMIVVPEASLYSRTTTTACAGGGVTTKKQRNRSPMIRHISRYHSNIDPYHFISKLKLIHSRKQRSMMYIFN